MKTSTRFAAYVLAAVAVATTSPAFADGKLLTTKAGMTVYTFDKDAPGKSNCGGSCTTVWPPVSAESMPSSSDITVITRDDGGKQAAFKNQPIYTYAADQKPGDKTGDGVGSVWHAVQQGQAPAPAVKSAPKSTDPGSAY